MILIGLETLKGGEGSGHFGHAGRPGEVGGSDGDGSSNNWKSSMSKKEADEWAKDSVYKDALYHGTSDENGDRITEEGFDKNAIGGKTGNSGMLGAGFYMTPSTITASAYGSKILELRVNVKNTCSPEKFRAIAKKYNFSEGFANDNMKFPTKMTSILKGYGYDSVQFKFSAEEVCVFDAKNITVIQR